MRKEEEKTEKQKIPSITSESIKIPLCSTHSDGFSETERKRFSDPLTEELKDPNPSVKNQGFIHFF